MLLLVEIGLVQGAVLFGAVLGLAVAFRAFHFPDLTVEASVPLGAAASAVALRHDVPPTLALLLAGLAGAFLGALTAILHVQFRINKFVAGILVIAAGYTFTLRTLGGSNLSLLRARSVLDRADALDHQVVSGAPFHTARLALVLAIAVTLAFITAVWLRSRHGLSMRAASANAEFAIEHGLPRKRLVVGALACTNALAGIAGGLLAMLQGFADVGMGQGFVVLCLASLSIGEVLIPSTRLARHTFIVLAALVGSLIYQIVAVVVIRLGVPATDLRLVTALVVLFVLLTRWRQNAPEVWE